CSVLVPECSVLVPECSVLAPRRPEAWWRSHLDVVTGLIPADAQLNRRWVQLGWFAPRRLARKHSSGWPSHWNPMHSSVQQLWRERYSAMERHHEKRQRKKWKPAADQNHSPRSLWRHSSP